MKNLSLYWRIQIIIWISSVLIGTFFYFQAPSLSILNSYPPIVLYATIGMFLMHLTRLFFIKIKLSEFNVLKQISYLTSVTIFFSLVQSLITIWLNHICHWENESFNKNSFGNKMLLFSFSNFFFFGIWNLGYFTYHYIQKTRKQQLDKVRLENELEIQRLESETTKAKLEALALRSEMNEMQKLQQTRAQIASDLHDDIGSALTSISYYTEFVKMQLKEDNGSLKPFFDKISNSARNTVSAMSDIVWIINPQNDTTTNLIHRMKRYASEMFDERNIQYTFNTNKEIEKLKLNMEQRKNLYLIYKEAIHNAVKYSQCSKIDIDFTGTDHEIRLSIKDNGKGFDILNAIEGNGLTNMKKRAEEIKADFEISSIQGKGTHIQVQM